MLKRLTKNIVYLPFGENDRPTLAAISGSKRTLLVDAGNSPNHAILFLSLLAEYDQSPVHYTILTHWHWDHCFGLSAMKTTCVAHKMTVSKMSEFAQLEWDDESINNRVQNGSENIFVRDMIKQEYPGSKREILIKIPEIAFTSEIRIDLGDSICFIDHVGGDHSPDSTIIFVPNEKVVFLGDCFYPNPYRNGEYTLQNVFPLIDKLLSYDADLYIDSHDNPFTKNHFHQKCKRLQEVGSLTKKYQYQKSEVIEELRNIDQKNGLTINETWFEEINYLVNAFQAGLDS